MKNLKKSSFTLIELVISMVIVGITIVSIPMMLATVSQSVDTSMKSNSFFSAYSTLSLIESMEWDENNTKDDNYYKVLTADNGDSELNCTRNGTKQLDNESGADCDDNKTSTIGIDDGEDADDSSTFDDVDDFNGYENDDLASYNFKVGVKYVQDNANYSDKNIFYNDDLTTSNNTNIKEIEINITDKNGTLISIIRGESFNIGAVKIYSRNDL
jgi:type II secretory pathway pseudopilin PulG